MNFEFYTIQRFKIGIDFYQRIYRVVEKNNGLIDIVNVLTGQVLFQNLDPKTILINGQLMTNINELQKVVFNQSCVCEGEVDDSDYKIFDLSFDKTFE